MEDRIMELEKKAAFQEYALSQMNEVLLEHQKKIEALQTAVKSLKDHSVRGDLVIPVDQELPPPHY
jgi:uncharacterized coiled-coil protein SlyX